MNYSNRRKQILLNQAEKNIVFIFIIQKIMINCEEEKYELIQ